MPDVFSKTKRSEVMSRIRGRGNRDTELALIRLFRREHISGWRRSHPLFGKPDFVLPKLKLAVFVDGCFWHSCPKHATFPKGNAAFWKKKLASNRMRDRKVTRLLRRQGWHVLRIWEHELTKNNSERLVVRLKQHIVRPSTSADRSVNSRKAPPRNVMPAKRGRA